MAWGNKGPAVQVTGRSNLATLYQLQPKRGTPRAQRRRRLAGAAAAAGGGPWGRGLETTLCACA